jgi:NTE family protein
MDLMRGERLEARIAGRSVASSRALAAFASYINAAMSSATALPRTPSRSKVGLVLAGGAARGAYEVGVVRYVLEEVAKALGQDVPLDIISGTSAGSINAAMLAARADEPKARGTALARRWTTLELTDVIRPSPREILHIGARMLGRASPSSSPGRHGGIFDPAGIERIVKETIPFDAIGRHLETGLISAVSISTTHVASGRTVVFIQRRGGGVPSWGDDPTMVPVPATIRAEHALASAAVPLLFPALAIDGSYYCDGGLRQNVPLSPARRLGAEGMIVINPRYIRETTPTPAVAEAREREYPDPLFVAGKAMNALLLDRIENDIHRLQKLNAVLAAGSRRFGPGFSEALNEELGRRGESALRPLDVVYLRASQDIGVLAADYVRAPDFAKRVRGVFGRVLRRIAEGEREADLLSYVLFDGPFAGRLIEIGWADARAKHNELVAFFARALGVG